MRTARALRPLQAPFGSRRFVSRERSFSNLGRPVASPEEFCECANRRRPLPPSDGISEHRAAEVESFDLYACNAARLHRTFWHETDAKIRFKQNKVILFGDQFVQDLRVHLLGFQKAGEIFGDLAMGPDNQAFVIEILWFGCIASSKAMRFADGDTDGLGKERPRLQSVPGIAQWPRKGDVGFALFQKSGNFIARAAQEPQLKTIKARLSSVRCETITDRLIEPEIASAKGAKAPFFKDEARFLAAAALS